MKFFHGEKKDWKFTRLEKKIQHKAHLFKKQKTHFFNILLIQEKPSHFAAA